jgi:uncharacterized protein
MKIYKAKVPKIAMEIVSSLGSSGVIEVAPEKVPELELDLRAIVEGWLKTEDRIHEEAREQLERRGMSYSEFRGVKRAIAKRENHSTGDEGLDWIMMQMVDCLVNVSPNVEEVFAEDNVLKRKIHDVFIRNTIDDETLDAEVRAKMKNIQEGTPAWEIEYQKQMREVKKKHGLIEDRGPRPGS